MIRHLIWDVDGTLFDTYPAIVGSLQAAAVDLGAPATYEETHDLALVSIDHCLATLSATYDLSLDTLGADFDRRYQEVPPADQPPFDGAPEVCQLIHSRGGLNLIVTHRRRAGLDRLLTTHGLADLFTDIISDDDGYPRKPDPGAFRTLIERHRPASRRVARRRRPGHRHPRRTLGRAGRGALRHQPDHRLPRRRPPGLRHPASPDRDRMDTSGLSRGHTTRLGGDQRSSLAFTTRANRSPSAARLAAWT